MRISTRLALGFGLVVLLSVLLASAGIATLSNLGRAMNEVLSETKEGNLALQDMARGLERQEGAIYAYAAGDPSDGYRARFREGHELAQAALEQIREKQNLLGPDGPKLVGQIVEQRQRFEKAAITFFDGTRQGAEMAFRYSKAEAESQKLHDLLHQLAALHVRASLQADQHATVLIWRGRIWTVVTSALVFISLIGLAMYLRRSVMVPLASMAKTAAAVGKSNPFLRLSYKGHDELGLISQQFNELLDKLERHNQLLAQQQGQAAQVLEAVLDLHDESLAVVDQSGNLVAANRAFRDRLESMGKSGTSIADKLSSVSKNSIDKRPLKFRDKRELGLLVSLVDSRNKGSQRGERSTQGSEGASNNDGDRASVGNERKGKKRGGGGTRRDGVESTAARNADNGAIVSEDDSTSDDAAFTERQSAEHEGTSKGETES